MLLYDAISRVVKAPIGAYAICADSINEEATAFYLKHQFQPLVSRAQTLFLPMKTAQDLVSSQGTRPRRALSISGLATMEKSGIH
jgi:hypothetical protein